MKGRFLDKPIRIKHKLNIGAKPISDNLNLLSNFSSVDNGGISDLSSSLVSNMLLDLNLVNCIFDFTETFCVHLSAVVCLQISLGG